MESADPDSRLIEAIAHGDANALQTLYQRHGLHLLNYLLGRLHDRAWAEEILQAVMVIVWQQAHNFRGESQVRTWLFGITRRQMLTAMRKRRDHMPLQEMTIEADLNVSQTVEQRLRVEALEAAMEKLTPDHQQALELVFYRGLTIDEAAQQLDVKANTLKSRIHRAKAHLRQLLVTEKNDHAR
jgi:RNA polymerase sigma factor (sigma-70 family)